METTSLLETLEHETGAAPEWSVIWLHGLGADGNDFMPIVPELVRPGWPAVRFVFPHAPVRTVTINNGMPMRAWYDIRDTDLANRADAGGVEASIAQVGALIDREATRGIPASRVVLAGFSQGGAITLAAGLRRATPLAGLVALSTYLPLAAAALQALPATTGSQARTQPVFMAHGSHDPVVPLQAGRMGAQVLRELGFALEWHEYPMAHQVCAEQIADLSAWFARVLKG